MRPSNQSKIRELLQRFPDGLTASEIASRVGIAGVDTVRRIREEFNHPYRGRGH